MSGEGQQGVVHAGNIYAEEEKQFLVYLFVPQSSSVNTHELIQLQGERAGTELRLGLCRLQPPQNFTIVLIFI